MWRVLSAKENEGFRYNYLNPEIWPEYEFGYVCNVEILLFGHTEASCGCFRCLNAETVYLFYPHDRKKRFPVPYTEQNEMLRRVLEDGVGFGIPLPGSIVSMPRYISYGYVRGLRHFACQLA